MALSKESFLPDEADCAETWRQLRWTEGPECPECGSMEIQTHQKKIVAAAFTTTAAGPVDAGLPTPQIRFWRPPTWSLPVGLPDSGNGQKALD